MLEDIDINSIQEGKVQNVTQIDVYNGDCIERVITPVIDGHPIKEIEGMRIVDCWDVHFKDGKLNGVVRVQPLKEGGKKPSFEDGVTVIGDTDEGGNGKVVQPVRGFAKEYDPSREIVLPVLNGVLVRTIEGYEIHGAHHIRNVDGVLNGVLTIEKYDDLAMGWKINVEHQGGERSSFVLPPRLDVPVINGKLMFTVDGKKIVKCRAAYNINGKFNGLVELALTGEPEQRARRPVTKLCPVIDGQLIEKIGNQFVINCEQNTRLHEGVLNGWIEVFNGDRYVDVWREDARGYGYREYGTYIAIVDGQLIEEIDGQKIYPAHEMPLFTRGGKICGIVNVLGRTLPVVDGHLVEKIDGVEIDDFSKVTFDDEGLCGQLRPLGSNEWLPVVHGRIVRPPLPTEVELIAQEKRRQLENLGSGLSYAWRFDEIVNHWEELEREYPEFQPFIERRREELAQISPDQRKIEDWLRQTEAALSHLGHRLKERSIANQRGGLDDFIILARIRKMREIIQADTKKREPEKDRHLKELEGLEDEVISMGGPNTDAILWNDWARPLGYMMKEYGYEWR